VLPTGTVLFISVPVVATLPSIVTPLLAVIVTVGAVIVTAFGETIAIPDDEYPIYWVALPLRKPPM
jgi:hypothetical protein